MRKQDASYVVVDVATNPIDKDALSNGLHHHAQSPGGGAAQKAVALDAAAAASADQLEVRGGVSKGLCFDPPATYSKRRLGLSRSSREASSKLSDAAVKKNYGGCLWYSDRTPVKSTRNCSRELAHSRIEPELYTLKT